MAEVLSDFVSDEYLQEFEEKYNKEKEDGLPSDDTKFQYAWCLVRSKLNSDVKKGVLFLEELVLKQPDMNHRRDYLYYLAVGHARLRDYNIALKNIKNLLQMEPGNRQAQELEKAIKSSMESDALKGAAIAGGGILAVGALIGLGMAILKK